MGLRLLSFLCDYIDLVQIGGGGKGEQVNTVFLALREWLLLLTGSGISDEIVCVCERERETVQNGCSGFSQSFVHK